MTNKLHRQIKGLSEDKSNKLNLISGNLGISIDGQRTVEVPDRDGYVWVRLRGNQSELIQAYNAAVSPIFGLPVLVVRSNNRYSVYGRDIEKYGDWGNSPYLPKHGAQHSFNPELGMGGDVTWIYSRQFVPLLAMPSGSAGAASLVVNPHIYREPDGSFTFIGNQGTPDATLAKPTNNQARIMLLYWDLNTNLPNMITGSLFDATITGTSQITPYIPILNDSQKIPLSAIRVVSGTTTIDWDNIYDVRQFATTTPPAFQGGFGVWDEGIPQGTGTVLNFIGAGITATVSGTVAQIVVTATGGGGTSSPWTTGTAGTNSIKAIGGGSNATGDYAVAHGQDTLATGTASTAEGNESVARGDYSHAEGNGTLAKGDESHAEGYQTVSVGLDSHAEGQSSIASGTASHAEGQNTIAEGFAAHAEGIGTLARGTAAHAGGESNKAIGSHSAVVGGIGNSSLGEGSVVLGGAGITGSSSYTTYVDRFHIQRLQTGTAIANLGIDNRGYVVTGTVSTQDNSGWIAKSETWSARTQAFTNDPAAGTNITLNVTNTEGARVGGQVNVSSSAGNEDATIVSFVANTSITVDILALNHTTTSRLITFLNCFTLSGDYSADADYEPGTKIKCTNNSATVKGIISDNIHVSGTTYITLIGNTDFSIVNSAITAPYISKIFKPDDFPGEFNYNPVWVNLVVGNGSQVGVWADLGGVIKQRGRLIFGSTTSVSGSPTVNIVSPSLSYPTSSRDPIGIVTVRDDDANRMYIGQAIMTTPTIAMRMLNLSAGTYTFQQNLSSTVPITWATSDEILFVADYLWR